MMKKLFLLIVPLLLATNLLPGQEKEGKPDKANYRKIAKENYDSLAGRLIAGDTTLTPDECAVLYYGFAYRPEYNGSLGYGEGGAAELLSQGEYQKACSMALQALATCPVSLSACMLILQSGHYLMTPIKELDIYAMRLRKLLDGIWSCGDGKSRKTAIKVLGIPDEYVIMQMLGLEVIDRRLENMKHDVIIVKPSEAYPEEKIYFDITLSLNHSARTFF